MNGDDEGVWMILAALVLIVMLCLAGITYQAITKECFPYIGYYGNIIRPCK